MTTTMEFPTRVSYFVIRLIFPFQSFLKLFLKKLFFFSFIFPADPDDDGDGIADEDEDDDEHDEM